MSSLWTPEGERPVRRTPTPTTEPAAKGKTSAGVPIHGVSGGDEPSEEERANWAQMQEQLARTPVELVVSNHAFGLFELAALHLSSDPPRLPQARVAIDALGALVEGMKGKLGGYEHQLVEGLSNLRVAYVQIRSAAPGEPGADPGPAKAKDGPAKADPGPAKAQDGPAKAEPGPVNW